MQEVCRKGIGNTAAKDAAVGRVANLVACEHQNELSAGKDEHTPSLRVSIKTAAMARPPHRRTSYRRRSTQSQAGTCGTLARSRRSASWTGRCRQIAAWLHQQGSGETSASASSHVSMATQTSYTAPTLVATAEADHTAAQTKRRDVVHGDGCRSIDRRSLLAVVRQIHVQEGHGRHHCKATHVNRRMRLLPSVLAESQSRLESHTHRWLRAQYHD